MIARIVSGGQTGVDRGALDAALEADFPCGGWCPHGRRAEDGPIDARYPLDELRRGGYVHRTERNVRESDATLILYFGRVAGGTLQTHAECLRYRRPCLMIDGVVTRARRAADDIARFIGEQDVRVLNVAGPRASSSQRAYGYAHAVITLVLGRQH